MNKRFQRPISSYSGSEDLLYRDKYQEDSKAVPKVAISSTKIDGDFNYLVDAVNTLDEDVKSVVSSGVANESVFSKHLAPKSITEEKLTENIIGYKHLKEASVTENKIADLSVSETKIANNSVTKDKMATSSIGTDELIDSSVTRDKLAKDAISDSVPIGTIAQFTKDLLPTGWIACNGVEISKDTYPQLVKFLTESDTVLNATLPKLKDNEECGVHYGIKAFSDTIDLANVEIAGLTQDVVKNTSEIKAIKEDVRFDPIAEAWVNGQGPILFGYNIKSVTRLSIGSYRVVLDESLKNINFRFLVSGGYKCYAVHNGIDYVNGSVDIEVIDYAGHFQDKNFYIRFFKVEEEVK